MFNKIFVKNSKSNLKWVVLTIETMVTEVVEIVGVVEVVEVTIIVTTDSPISGGTVMKIKVCSSLTFRVSHLGQVSLPVRA